MPWQLELGGRFQVSRDGVDLGSPPSRTAAILLVGLISRADVWSGRAEIAKLLYPDKDVDIARAAFRQALCRLRLWLGEGAVETQADRLRLSSEWELGLDLPSGAPASASLIAPGLEHSWLDAVRLQWRQPESDARSPHESFAEAVLAAARLDRNDGRALLVGGRTILLSLPPSRIPELLAATRPASRLDPQAMEYLEVRGLVEFGDCALSSAAVSFGSAYRLAREQRKDLDGQRIAAYAAFVEVERGNTNGADVWISRLGRSCRGSLLASNLLAAHAWNANRIQEALSMMKAAVGMASQRARQEQVHFWANLAALAAEAGELELSLEAEQRCVSLAIPDLDHFWHEGLELARTVRLMAGRQLDEALHRLGGQPDPGSPRSWRLPSVYEKELAALCRAEMGDRGGARREWSAAVTARADGHGALNPRLKARARRILAAA